MILQIPATIYLLWSFEKVKHFSFKELIIFQMFLKFQLFCWTLLVVTGDILEFKESTVFIYYDVVFDLPDCLGTLITANYVLTGASCFIKPKKSKLDFITHSSDKNAKVVRVILFISKLNRIIYFTTQSMGPFINYVRTYRRRGQRMPRIAYFQF